MPVCESDTPPSLGHTQGFFVCFYYQYRKNPIVGSSLLYISHDLFQMNMTACYYMFLYPIAAKFRLEQAY